MQFISLAVIVILIILLCLIFIRLKKVNDKWKEIEKQKINYESIIDKANDAMLVIDIVDGRILQSNPSAASLLGYEKEKLESSTLFELHPKEYLNKSSSIVADAWEKGGLIYKDIPFITKSGELLPVECSAKVAPFKGRPAIVIYARDIRERLKMENEILKQKEIIEQKNKDITDSINYARGTQFAILPDKKELKGIFPQSFIFFKPKDIVSGDFYWFLKQDHSFLIAATDCTGHGVPGALMSMIGHSYLNEIVIKGDISKPSVILNELRKNVVKTLKRRSDGTESKDGMDINMCSININSKILQYAGAFNPLWIIRNGELIEIQADKFPIGNYFDDNIKPFTNHEFQLQKGDSIYLFTDGYADQFGGPKGKKFKYKQFQELLISIQDKNFDEQKDILKSTIKEWRGKLEQVDDILVIGLKVE